VRRFSLAEIENTRFLRQAVELEVMERACLVWDQSRVSALAENLNDQAHVLAAGDAGLFHDLDYEFHKLMCDLTGLPRAFETIERCKRKVDRLCVLSLSNHESAADILEDHRAIAEALSRRAVQDARALVRLHVGRLDKAIAEIHQTHTEYFQ
jgi:DNA-binding GntR family transcriptional regulator